MTFDDVWNILYTGSRLVYEAPVTVWWMGSGDKKADTPVCLDFHLSDQGQASRPKTLSCLFNLSESHTPTQVSHMSA